MRLANRDDSMTLKQFLASLGFKLTDRAQRKQRFILFDAPEFNDTGYNEGPYSIDSHFYALKQQINDLQEALGGEQANRTDEPNIITIQTFLDVLGFIELPKRKHTQYMLDSDLYDHGLIDGIDGEYYFTLDNHFKALRRYIEKVRKDMENKLCN